MGNAWDSNWKENYSGSNAFGRYRLNSVVKIISKNVAKKSKFLDIGIGPGDLSALLKKQGYKQFGIDYSKESLKICKKRHLHAKLDNALKLKIKDKSYDLSLSDGLLEHFENIKDVKQIISEHIRVSKKYIFISLPSTYWTNTLYRLIKPYYVKEYRIPFKDFKKMLTDYKDVKIKKSGYYNFGLCYYVLLEKKSHK